MGEEVAYKVTDPTTGSCSTILSSVSVLAITSAMSDQIPKWNVVHRLEKKKLLIGINSVAALSILFFGYDQGMMAGVNNSKHYIDLMGFGYTEVVDGHPAPVVTDSLLQGGIVSVYYLGTLCGAFVGGWMGDRIGRIRTIAAGAVWATLGAGLQCSAQNHDWMICGECRSGDSDATRIGLTVGIARLINGVGTGILNAIVPVWATETAEHTSRGQFIAIEFTLNIFGVVLAYWLEL